ncbi:hypothetical protein CW751_08045 [Brumimicrobium salinarum]|uniref:DUF3368 domain-containing protein n=1 Tax=Brumimicrobium salinarum TaxID=2058658 RepID=A0A2I0R2A6_9FLAO|nr:hypothetical protein [Brumimicrobium salinarum]PKR80712.1 hypothetical protein CW751_08045 [Brumimicrobium salinarum]
MKIAITDACIFIDLHDLNLTVSFFSIDLELYTSLDVLNELYPEQRNVLDAFVSVGKLTIHTIASAERIEIMNTNYPRALSEVDKTVLFLAKKHEAIVLSSDKVIRNHAKKVAIEYHGMLWIFDQLIEQGILSKKEASEKLKELIQQNVMYQNNSKLMKEFEGRLMDWEDN